MTMVVDWKSFLEDVAPTQHTTVVGIIDGMKRDRVATPSLNYYCDTCKAFEDFAAPTVYAARVMAELQKSEIRYLCTRCHLGEKLFYLRVTDLKLADGSGTASVVKVGEWPPFRSRVPNRLRSLLGPDADLFALVRLSESMGLGVAAFTYYRRVVERQKDRFLTALQHVAQQQNLVELHADLERAKRETQFSKAVEEIKSAIPDAVRIGGHNPLKLLHDVLSDGVHDLTDSACLELGHSIRVILVAFAERITAALHDDAELSSAISRLLRHQRDSS